MPTTIMQAKLSLEAASSGMNNCGKNSDAFILSVDQFVVVLFSIGPDAYISDLSGGW